MTWCQLSLEKLHEAFLRERIHESVEFKDMEGTMTERYRIHTRSTFYFSPVNSLRSSMDK